LEPSSIVRSLWEPRTLPSIIAYSSKPIDNRGGATLLEGTREQQADDVVPMLNPRHVHTYFVPSKRSARLQTGLE
jgi:hypothetical protein